MICYSVFDYLQVLKPNVIVWWRKLNVQSAYMLDMSYKLQVNGCTLGFRYLHILAIGLTNYCFPSHTKILWLQLNIPAFI